MRCENPLVLKILFVVATYICQARSRTTGLSSFKLVLKQTCVSFSIYPTHLGFIPESSGCELPLTVLFDSLILRNRVVPYKFLAGAWVSWVHENKFE